MSKKSESRNASCRVGKALLLGAMTLLLITGCWDRRELDSLAIVMAAGVDLAEQGDVIELVTQIVQPGSVRKSETGGQSGGQSTFIIKSVGSNVADAATNTNNDLSRHLYWAHNEVLIISEVLARQGVRSVLDFFYRTVEPRERMQLMVCRGKPEEILSAKGVFGTVPALSLADIIGPYRRTSTTVSMDLRDFLDTQLSKTTSAYLPIVQRHEDHFAITGTAVFDGDRMVGEFTPQETRGLLWTLGQVKGGMLVVGSQDEAISLEIRRVSSRVSTRVSGGVPYASVTIYVASSLGSQMTASDLSTPEMVETWESSASEVIKAEALLALRKAQQLNTDLFRFGERIHRDHPSEWRKLEKSWDSLFPRLAVEITVQFTLEQTGMVSKRIAPFDP